MAAFAVALVCAAVAGSTTAAAPPSSPASDAATPRALASANCTALIQKGKKLVPVYERVYKYKFVKVKHSSTRFKRTIVHVRQKMKVPCARQCVKMVKKKKKLKPVYVVLKKKIKVPKHGVLKTVKKRIRTYKFTKCKAIKNSTSLGTPVSITLLDGSKANLDFGAFQREAPVTGALKGFVPGGIHLGTDFQITLSSGALAL
ncbi:MAG: hypothetical protein ACJ8F7_17590, partial [Gemmataceae bacterium]